MTRRKDREPNPYAAAGRPDATAEQMEEKLIALSTALGFDIEENETHRDVVRTLLFIQLKGTAPNFLEPYKDLLAQCYPSERQAQLTILRRRVRATLSTSELLPLPSTSEDEATLLATYKTWAASLKPNTSEAGSYLAKRTEIAEALLRVKNYYEVDIAAMHEAGKNATNNDSTGSPLRKAIRSAIGLCLKIDAASVSAVILAQLARLQDWEGLLAHPDQEEWSKVKGRGNSFGNSSTVRRGIVTEWQAKLQDWLAEFVQIEEDKGVTLDPSVIYECLIKGAGENDEDDENILMETDEDDAEEEEDVEGTSEADEADGDEPEEDESMEGTESEENMSDAHVSMVEDDHDDGEDTTSAAGVLVDDDNDDGEDDDDEDDEGDDSEVDKLVFIKGMRRKLEKFLVAKAHAAEYPDMNHVLRNIRASFDPGLGVGAYQSLGSDDEEMLRRCLKEFGVGSKGYVQAAVKTGLSYMKLYNWAQVYGLEELKEEIVDYDMSRPVPTIARLQVVVEDEQTDDSDGDEENSE